MYCILMKFLILISQRGHNIFLKRILLIFLKRKDEFEINVRRK